MRERDRLIQELLAWKCPGCNSETRLVAGKVQRAHDETCPTWKAKRAALGADENSIVLTVRTGEADRVE